jgi:BirA family biotin operon repressor/biotin-[acetyl-CoA-carboxylase] ligase
VTDHLPRRPPLDPDRLAEAGGGTPGWRVEVLAEAPSTNLLAAERARAGEDEGLVLVAEHQTAGRGRLDRAWTTPPRAALTLFLRPGVDPARWPWLPLLVGVAVADAVGHGARLKWPNDVLLGDHKLAGLLVERVETPGGPAAVVGIGINVSTTAQELPVPGATSLHVAGHEVDRTDLLLDVLAELGRGYASWTRNRHEDAMLRAAYGRRCATVGQLVRVELPGGTTITGTAVDVDHDGRLVVRSGGETTVVGAGDVVHVRPAG